MHHGLLVGAGFLLGSVGVHALKSEQAHKAAVAIAKQGLYLKDEAEAAIEEAKAEVEDVLAEAGYKKETEEESAEEGEDDEDDLLEKPSSTSTDVHDEDTGESAVIDPDATRVFKAVGPFESLDETKPLNKVDE